MYFGEREFGEAPRISDELTPSSWRAIIAEITRRTQDGFLAQAFPLRACPDGHQFITGCDIDLFYDRLRGDHPRIATPLSFAKTFETIPALELIEWVFQHISQPISPEFHSYRGDYHYGWFSQSAGQAIFADNINSIFRRRSLAFELGLNGEIRRIVHPC